MPENAEVMITCCHCDGVFPAATVANDDEARRAGRLERGQSARVARYCPWCGKTVMIELHIQAAAGPGGPVPTFLEAGGSVRSRLPEPEPSGTS